MPLATAELVLFAVRAGVRVSQATRQAYIDRTRMLEIRLPMPMTNLVLDEFNAHVFFEDEGAELLTRYSRIAELHKKMTAGTLAPGAETDEYVHLFLQHSSIHLARKQGIDVGLADARGATMSPDALESLLNIEQWEQDDPNRPKPLRKIIGTLIEVGVEYFATMPGAISGDSRHSKTLLSFVRAVDTIDFVSVAMDDAPWESLMGGLLVAALETIGDQPELIASDRHVQRLVTVTTGGLASDIGKRLASTDDLHERDRIRSWGETVFRSILRTAGTHVLDRPGVFFGVDGAPEQALVSRVGKSALALVATDSGIDPGALFSMHGLETILSSSLQVVADHPELIVDTDNEGIEALMSAIARDLSDMDRVLDLDLVPEIARTVLSRTGDHVELIWPDLAPENHLLLTAAKSTLEVLTMPRTGRGWNPAFGREDLLTVVDAVVDEVAGNPAWLIRISNDADANLAAALEAALLVLRRRTDKRLSQSLASEVLAETVRAIALRQRFVEELPNGKIVVASALDAVFTELFKTPEDSDAAWSLLRHEAVYALVGAALKAFASSELDQDAIALMKKAISGIVDRAVGGEPVDLDKIVKQVEDVFHAVTEDE